MAVKKYIRGRFAVILSIIIMVAILGTCDDDNDKSINPGDGQDIVEEFDPDTILFVAPGGTGDGTYNNPLGSIRTAIDIAGQNDTFSTIFLAVGEFHESIIINHGVNISGGHNPDSSWALFGDDSTILYGDFIDSEAVAVFIQDIESQVSINYLTIMAHDAVYPRRDSYGVICSNASGVDKVKFANCLIISGNGADGTDGQGGINGINGEDGYYSRAGQVPIPGGGGGRGAEDWFDEAEPGDTGFCADGTRTGGAGAINFALQAEPGSDGSDGIDGSCLAATLYIKFMGNLPLLGYRNGESGTDGKSGCDGGGGAGTGVTLSNTGYDPGGWGGGGGAGGTGGTGGGRGIGGGSSITILCYSSGLSLTDCTLKTSQGGNGGDGKAGGPAVLAAPVRPEFK